MATASWASTGWPGEQLAQFLDGPAGVQCSLPGVLLDLTEVAGDLAGDYQQGGELVLPVDGFTLTQGHRLIQAPAALPRGTPCR
jgi:hypothetical protein